MFIFQVSKTEKVCAVMNVFNRLLYKYKEIRNVCRIRASIKKLGGQLIGRVNLKIRGDLYFGNNLILNGKGIDTTSNISLYVGANARLNIGDNVGISQTSIYCKQSIEIGDYVKIGAGCLIFDSNFHSTDWEIRSDRSKDTQNAKSAPVKIENYAFIGARCIITKGVTIGERSIISAGSVVIGDIPSDCIAGGNPCKIVKFINSKELQ